MEFTIDKIAKEAARKALDEITYEGKTLKEWVEIIVKQDCISREEAKNLFLDGTEGYDCRGFTRMEIGEMLDELPSVTTQQTRWIPVSERLPKAFENVNCTCHSLIDDREDWVIETAYIPQPSDSPYSDWGNIPMLNSGDCKVVAWMHRDIPEPYKAESEEEIWMDEN